MAQALLAVGAGVNAVGTVIGGKSEAKQLKSEARQLERNAGLERATSQRQSIDERRQAELASSRALALTAASGGGADDPTVVNIISDLEGEGEYRALTALYNGEQSARGMEDEATARRKEAKNVKRASLFKAAGSILSSGSSLADRYAPKGGK